MLSISPNSIARSSLEEMLDSLRQRDENEKPKDIPPALPARPKPTSRARLPSAKRPLPTNFEIGESETAQSSSNCNVKKERRNSFGTKKVKEMEPGESPYLMAAPDDKGHSPKSEEKDNAKLANSSPGSSARFRESEWDDNVGYFINKKLRVWCRLHNGPWESGQIQTTSGEKASVLLLDGRVVTVPTKDLLPANPDILEGVDDLIELSYLNEPSVLHNLHYRYSQDIVYSKAGPVLVAVNPFKDVQLYGNDFVTAYRQKLLDSPHVYAVADTAYNEMMTGIIPYLKLFEMLAVDLSLRLSSHSDTMTCCLIDSSPLGLMLFYCGESGAGKTETAKIAMQYLAALGGGGGGIESEVLQTSCVLEAFGNAKTARNDNSSRFLAQGERSYHIFYQLCAGATSDLRGRLRLKRACDYSYLSQSDCLEIHDVDDAQNFHKLLGALNTIRICKDDQEHAFEMLAAVLWLGNISFHVIDNENHIEVVNFLFALYFLVHSMSCRKEEMEYVDQHPAPFYCNQFWLIENSSAVSFLSLAVISAAALIGCGTEDLMLALSTHSIHAGKDKVAKRLTLQQAIDTRDSLAKFIYASLFDWLVEKINLSLVMGKQHTGRSISILDIYGFESFKKNSFEQFCINYANERLQQHFNRHLFKLQQEKPLGLISLLDEESHFPKATDLTFATKLKQHLNANQCFKGERGGAFSVRHYAGEVLYDTREFLEKNRDFLNSEIIQLLSSCTRRLPQLFSSMLKQTQKPASSSIKLGIPACHKHSVATKFKGQLFKLMQQLECTTPHFIRCIKPNGKQIPGAFDKDLVLEQLRCCGVLEVVRISRSGYGFLVPENNACQDPLSTSVVILQQFDILPEMYQVGFKKLYFRAGQIAALEDVRKQVLQGTLEVQKCFRGHRARRYFHELKGGVVTLQSYIRGEIARKEHKFLLRLKKEAAWKKLDEQLMTVVQIQSVIRGWLVRRRSSNLRKSRQSSVSKRKPGRRISEIKDLPPEMLPSVVEELQKRVLMAEVTIGRKEKENAALREQVQMSLAAAKKSLGSDNTTSQPGKISGFQSPCFYDSEDMGPQTPTVSTEVRFLNNGIEATRGGETNDALNPVSPLVKEFEQRKHNFDDEAQAIVEVKSGHAPSVNLVEELRRLKHNFETWKKDFKVRLREAKAKVHKLGHADAEKHRRKWWGKKTKRF
ncbi:hypothetical protein DH2020_034685 [Rehmannia glutinosa]|uniref:Uncharacterized protein n=1 Tax=Rehmannia glutinosa TaxID=99300 RepID=A0ABR0V8M0_REHGL